MSKKSAKNLRATTFAEFQNRVNTIVETRIDWQKTLFADANDVLYAMLAEVYELYELTVANASLSEDAANWLLNECEKKKLPLTKKPTHLQLLVKFIFSDSSIESRRISSYTRVLTAALLSKEVNSSADVPNFIRSNGGVEEIRAALAKNTKPPRERARLGRELADKRKAIETVSIAEVGKYATEAKGSYVTLVGKVTAQGTVEIKHICFEQAVSKNILPCATSVKTALSNLYSNVQKTKRLAQPTASAENASSKKTDNIVAAPNEPAANDQPQQQAA